jgi:HEAT repeat protein
MPLIRKDPPANAPPKGPGPAIADLASNSVDRRWAAARSAASEPGGIEALGRALAVEANPRVREAILTALARAGSAEAVDAVLPHLRSDHAGLRTAALDTLRAMPKALAPHLAGLLRDQDSDVRLLACDLARDPAIAGAADLLCDLLACDPSANVCAAAVEVLAEIGEEAALPALAQCATRFPADPFLAFAVEMATQQILSQPPGRP